MSKSLGAISTFIKKIKGLSPSEGCTLLFRGHSDSDYIDLPSIYRTHKDNKAIYPFIEEEHNLYRKIIMACSNEFSSCKSTFDHLVKMQHYNLPTRLLDITTNPLVALYFACRDHRGKGGKTGEVVVYEVPTKDMKFYCSDTVSVIANIAKRPNDLSISTLSNLDIDKRMNNKSYTRFIHEIQEEKPYFKNEIELDHLESVVCVQPKLDNQRIIKQSGAFLLFGINETKLKPAMIKVSYYKKDEDGHRVRLLIAQNGKNTILNELAELSISEATLFPEIDKVSSYLKSQLEMKNS